MTSELIRSRPGADRIRAATDGPAHEVAPGIWQSDGMSNSFMVTTPEGRLIINAGLGFEGGAHRQRYDAVDDSPVRYLVFTQGHVDHLSGTDQLIDPDTVIVAQAANAACQADDARIHRFRVLRSAVFWSEVIGQADEWIRRQPPGTAAMSTPVPHVTFDDSHVIELGGERFELLSTPGGETIDSLVVWMPERRIAFTGNLFSCLFGHIPNLVTVRGDRMRDPLRFVESADRVLGLDAELLLTGHFAPIVGADVIRAEITRVRDATQWLHDATVEAMNGDGDVWEAMATIRLPDELAVGEGYGKAAWDVRAIWELYGGWFHHRSTTELYGVHPMAHGRDLVELAGGPDPVVARAAARVDAGEPLAALPLLEAVLEVDRQHPGAWTLWRDAHDALLAVALAAPGGPNFWEVGWLQRQIDRADRRLSP